MKVLSIDIGGTSIKYGEVSEGTTIDTLRVDSVPTSDSSSEEIINTLRKIVAASDADAVSITVPGVYDKQNDIVLFGTNILLTGQHIAQSLNTEKKVLVENDANAATFGEYAFGFDEQPESMVMITLGTGVGGGVILKRKLLSGKITATELGHMAIMVNGRQCNCGNKGCFEKYCSVSGLIMTYQEISGDPSGITVEEIVARYKDGESAAIEAFDYYALCLAYGIVSVINLITPEHVRIGGGLCEISECYFDKTKEYVEKMVFPGFKGVTTLSVARLKNSAAVLGGLEMIKSDL